MSPVYLLQAQGRGIGRIAMSELGLLRRFPRLGLAALAIAVVPAIYAMIYLSSVWDPNAKTNALPVTAASYNDTGLTPATAYSWTVKAVDTNALEGATSNAATATTTGTPPPAATCFTSSNYAHTVAGRADPSFGYTYANGSNQNMGLWNIYTVKTLKKTATNYYTIGTCP